MNKWSLLLFSVLGLLLSTTSELNFVDGRVGCCDRSSHPLLSDTRLSIYEPHCTYHTFTEISQLISPKRDIRYATKNIELKRSSRSDSRRGQFDDRRISSDERFRVLRNYIFGFEDSTSSNGRGRISLREINDLQLRRNLKSFSRNKFRENHVDRSRTRNNDFLRDKMELERRINAEEELSEIRVNRFRQNDEPVSVNLKERKLERIHRRTFVIRTNIMLNPRENIDETRLRFIQKNEGRRNMERSNLDISNRQRLFRDTRLTTDLSRNSDRRFKTDDRDSNERHVTMRLDSKIGILRNGNIRNYRRLSVRDDSIEKMYEREGLTDSRRNTDMDGRMNAYRRSYDKDISEKRLERSNIKNVQNERFKRLDIDSSRHRTIQRESERSGNRIRDDKMQINNGFEKRLFEERYSTQRIPRQNSNINRLQEIRQARFYNDMILEDAEDYSKVFIERTERASDQNRNRKIRENNREIRLSEEYTFERSTQRNKINLVEKRAISSNINNRRSEAIRHSVLERRERENTRYRLDHEDKNIFDQRRIKQIMNINDEDMLRDSRNTPRKLIRGNVMGQEINNVRQNYDDDSVSHGFLVRDDNNRKLVSRLERERLSLTGKRVPQIRIIQRENQSKMHNRAINIHENRKQEVNNLNRLLVSNTNRNEEKRQARTYNEKSDREEFRNSWVRDGERAFDERRIRQVRDNHEHRPEYRLNVERIVERVSTHNDRNKNNIVERGVLSIKSSIGNNRLYGIIRSTVTVLRRRENDEVRYRSVHENERVSDQRRTRDVPERRENNLSNERLAQRILSPRNNINNAMLNNNRRSYNDENNSQVIFARTYRREISNRLERDRFSSVNKLSSYLRMIQRENKNNNDNRLLINIEENRLRNERYAKIIEKQESAIRPEFVNQNQNTKRVLILLQFREKDVPRLIHLNKRDFEQSRNGILRNRREFTRVDDYSRNIRIAQTRGLRNTNERFNIREIRNKVITRSIETEFYDSDESHYERRTERVIRNIVRHRMSINNRVLQEARSENQGDANRELEYIRYVRSDNVLRNSAHRENKDNVMTSDRDNIRGRDEKDRARDIRAFNGLQILKEESRITKTRRTNEEEREIRTAFSKIRYLPIEHKTQSDQLFEIKLQYIFYLLQGLYILGFFTKFTKNSNSIQKNRFSNWFPLFSTLKVD